jgi:hypothetical protein
MLGPVDIRQYMLSDYDKAAHDDQLIEPLDGFKHAKIDWVICGPETGAGKRTYEWRWIQEMRADCAEWGCAFFDKREGGLREWPKIAFCENVAIACQWRQGRECYAQTCRHGQRSVTA